MTYNIYSYIYKDATTHTRIICEQADSAGGPKDCAMRAAGISKRRREKGENRSFPLGTIPKRRRERETVVHNSILPDAHRDITRIHATHTHTHKQTHNVQEKRSKKKETIDYSTK